MVVFQQFYLPTRIVIIVPDSEKVDGNIHTIEHKYYGAIVDIRRKCWPSSQFVSMWFYFKTSIVNPENLLKLLIESIYSADLNYPDKTNKT